jgi:hypothetical protein
MAKAALVASQGEALPVGRDPVPVRDFHAAGGSIGDVDDVVVPVHGGEIGYLPVVGPEDRGTEFQLLGNVRGPSLGEALPDEDGDRPGAQAAPQDGLEGPRIRGGHDADEIIFGDAEDPSGFLRGAEQFFLAQRGAVGTPDRGIPQRVEGPAGPLAAGA